MSSFAGFFQMAVLIISIGGGFFAPIRNHRLYAVLQRNKIIIILAAFIGLNIVKNLLESTGAFEIYLNGELIHSKLQNGRVPEIQEILAKITI